MQGGVSAFQVSPVSVSLHIQGQKFQELHVKTPHLRDHICGYKFSRRKWFSSHMDPPFSTTLLLMIQDCTCSLFLKSTVHTYPALFILCVLLLKGRKFPPKGDLF
jgi:hypothetical protein